MCFNMRYPEIRENKSIKPAIIKQILGLNVSVIVSV